MKKLTLVAALSLSALAMNASAAGSVTGNFDVTINLTSACRITTAPGNIAVSYTSFVGTDQSNTTPFAVQCTNTLPYTMALSAATGTLLGLNYTLVIRNSGDTADVTGTQTAGAAATSFRIKATVGSGQQGTCATPTCSATSAAQTLTISY